MERPEGARFDDGPAVLGKVAVERRVEPGGDDVGRSEAGTVSCAFFLAASEPAASTCMSRSLSEEVAGSTTTCFADVFVAARFVGRCGPNKCNYSSVDVII